MNTLRDPDSGSVENTTAPADSDRAAEVRAGLVDTLLATGTITPPLELAYNPDD